MAIPAVGQPPPPEVVKTLTSTLAANPIAYASTLNPNTAKHQKIQLKPIQYLHETTTAIAWISFPTLPPNFFGKEAIFSLAAAVGKPLQVDMATQKKTRPSCARVKAEVERLGEFPKRINMGVRKRTGEVMEKWIPIRYDYVPKYCKNCKLQGHNETDCFILHPELYAKEEKGKRVGKERDVREKLDQGQRIDNKKGCDNV
ncbi:hypothetical protein H5410_005390 [Solanum commersonii]|uniref:DUF4283 domain-containing protein n=1 Tax=Solanum commersonii TaxID=4109 RepID=A0A9J6A7F8_SOLCO|nr:hypothetical protein H5410_005390 [Solanum commersonii]